MGLGKFTLGDQQPYQPFGSLEVVRVLAHSGAKLGHRTTIR